MQLVPSSTSSKDLILQRFLASSGKDRSICIYSRLEDPNTGDWSFAPVLCYKNAHKRIIWDLRYIRIVIIILLSHFVELGLFFFLFF